MRRARAASPPLIHLTCALIVAPVAIDLVASGLRGAFRYTAADAFLYHTVARNFAELGFPTYDQSLPTNGFHPLWQLVLTGLYAFCQASGLGEPAYLGLSVLLSALLVAAGVGLMGVALWQSRRAVPPSFVLVPVGLVAALVAPFWAYRVLWQAHAGPIEGKLPLYGTSWSFANGMESGITLLFLGLLALAHTGLDPRRTRNAAIVGFLASLLTLSRLDHGVFGLAACGLFLLTAPPAPSRRMLASACAVGGAFAVPLVVYLAVNLHYAGAAIPVSGQVKSFFPDPVPALRIFQAGLRQTFQGHVGPGVFFRLAQIVIPLAVALCLLGRTALSRGDPGKFLVRLRERCDRFEQFLLAAAVGVVVLAFYDLLFVSLGHQGPWYFPASILVASMALLPRGTRANARARARVAVYAALALAVFGFLHRQPRHHARYHDFYTREAPRVRAFYGDRVKIIEMDDGILAFSTGLPTFSGFFFTADVASIEAFRMGRGTDALLRRGFDRVASVAYPLPKVAEGRPLGSDVTRALAAHWPTLIGPRRAVAEIEYVSPDPAENRAFIVLRLRPWESRRP